MGKEKKSDFCVIFSVRFEVAWSAAFNPLDPMFNNTQGDTEMGSSSWEMRTGWDGISSPVEKEESAINLIIESCGCSSYTHFTGYHLESF